MACIPGLWHARVAGAVVRHQQTQTFVIRRVLAGVQGFGSAKGLSLGTARALANAGFPSG
jgi:hypothetical protein